MQVVVRKRPHLSHFTARKERVDLLLKDPRLRDPRNWILSLPPEMIPPLPGRTVDFQILSSTNSQQLASQAFVQRFLPLGTQKEE
jgi:hypothetical protein